MGVLFTGAPVAVIAGETLDSSRLVGDRCSRGTVPSNTSQGAVHSHDGQGMNVQVVSCPSFKVNG